MSQQCKATNRRGERCKSFSIEGGTVCRMHGGGAPQVRARAQARLLELVDPALAALARNIRKTAPEAVQIRAAAEVLNRADLALGVEDKSLTALGNTIAAQIVAARKKRLGEDGDAD